MNSTQQKDLFFYCWQLDLRTLGDLAKFKATHKAHTITELLQALATAYNSRA